MDHKREKVKTESLEESRRVIVDSNGRHFRAESFDRFGDDLTEELLSYLSVEDKIRLQSVAKQWNRCLRSLVKKERVIRFSVSYKGSKATGNCGTFSLGNGTSHLCFVGSVNLILSDLLLRKVISTETVLTSFGLLPIYALYISYYCSTCLQQYQELSKLFKYQINKVI